MYSLVPKSTEQWPLVTHKLASEAAASRCTRQRRSPHTPGHFTFHGAACWLGFDARINDLNEAAHARLTPNLRCRWKVLMEELLHANSLSSLTLVRRRSRRTVKRCTRAR